MSQRRCQRGNSRYSFNPLIYESKIYIPFLAPKNILNPSVITKQNKQKKPRAILNKGEMSHGLVCKTSLPWLRQIVRRNSGISYKKRALGLNNETKERTSVWAIPSHSSRTNTTDFLSRFMQNPRSVLNLSPAGQGEGAASEPGESVVDNVGNGGRRSDAIRRWCFTSWGWSCCWQAVLTEIVIYFLADLQPSVWARNSQQMNKGPTLRRSPTGLLTQTLSLTCKV